MQADAGSQQLVQAESWESGSVSRTTSRHRRPIERFRFAQRK
jgi:hypothetical protein